MDKEFNKFVIFTVFGEGLSLAHHLLREGKDVLVGMVGDLKDVQEKKPEDKKGHAERWNQYRGFFPIMDAWRLLEQMQDFEDKDEWFVIFDFNSLYAFAAKARQYGFSNGLFPSKLDYFMEADRDFAKKFVQSNYPMVKVAEVEQFKTIEEGIEFITESDEFWALKGNDSSATTVVPAARDLENVKSELIDALQGDPEAYQKKGFILERQIRDGVNVCPQMVYYNGKRVASSVDIEDKNFSASDGSEKYGCALNCIVSTEMNCLLNEVAFVGATDKLAKKHAGLYYIDNNLILKDGEFYYLEFCSGRMGYDAVYAECDMAGGVSNYFNKLARGENPYERKYGVGTRGFMMKRDEDGTIKDGISMRFPDEIVEHLWPFGWQRGDGKFTNTKGSFGDCVCGIDLAAFTESSDDYDYAKIKLNEVISSFSFNGFYARRDYNVLDPHLWGIEKYLNPSVVEEGKN